MNRVDQRCQNKKHVRPRWWPGYPRSILICMRATRSFQAFHFNWRHSHLSNRCCFDSLGFYRFPRRRKPLFSAISWEFSSPGPREEALSHEFPIPVRPNFSEKIRTIFAENEKFSPLRRKTVLESWKHSTRSKFRFYFALSWTLYFS